MVGTRSRWASAPAVVRALVCAFVCVVAGACSSLASAPHSIPVNHFLGDPMDIDSVRRVMVLPFQEAEGVQAQTAQVREAFINELVKIQRFEVVPLPGGAAEHRELYHGLTKGNLSTDALVRLGERYRIDGVMLGTLTSYRAYTPPNLGMRLQLVSLHSGQVVWAAEGLYDSNDARVIEDLQHYAGSFQAEEDSMHGWQINLISPMRYAGYVSHRLVGTWRLER